MNRTFTIILSLISVFLYTNFSQAADYGPYYLSYDDYCEIYEIHLTQPVTGERVDKNAYQLAFPSITTEPDCVTVTSNFGGSDQVVVSASGSCALPETELYVYGREIGCERESVILSGQYIGKDGNSKIPLHYSADGVRYLDVINLKTGLSSFYYADGSSMDYIVESSFNFSNSMPD